MSLRVRRLAPADAAFAARAVAALKAPAPESAGEKHFRRFLSRAENVLVVAEEDGAPVGFLVGYVLDRVDRPRAMVCLYEIEVSEPRRRRGVGRAMVEELLALSRRGNAMKTWVITDARNEAALRLYAAAGGLRDRGDGVVFVWTGKD